MTGKVAPVPPGYHTATPHLTVKGAVKAIEFYKKAFGATEPKKFRENDDEPVMHAEIKIGNSFIFLNDEFPAPAHGSPEKFGGTPVTIHLYVEDADAVYNSAVNAGAEIIFPIEDAFWGDRYGVVKDPFGHQWAIASHLEDLTHAQIKERAEAYFAAKQQ